MKLGRFIKLFAIGRGLSRRELFKRAGIVGAASALPGGAKLPAAATVPAQVDFETLTVAESATLEAIVARLIPTDENGPGATEARAARYIDRALDGALASRHQDYVAGLAAVEAYAQISQGAAFVRLSDGDQDAVLGDMEKDVATGFDSSSSEFFALLRAHTIQGTFCDPYYGGNADFVGWDLIGYPGVRVVVTPSQQRLDTAATPRRRSAYDSRQFSRPDMGRGR